MVRQRERVRWLAFLFLFSSIATIHAQEQERALVDRLLQPNMELRNPAQGKSFRADSRVVGHRDGTNTFVLAPATKQQTFADARPAQTRQYQSGAFRGDSRQHALVETRQATIPGQLSSSSAPDIHAAYDAHSSVPGRTFADERPFRDQGKAQKSLNQKNRPLTIDQVRELLNKN